MSNQLTEEAAKYLHKAIGNNCQQCALILSRSYISDNEVRHLREAIINKNCQPPTLDLRQ